MGHIRGKGHHRTTASHSPVRALVVVLVIVAVLVGGGWLVVRHMQAAAPVAKPDKAATVTRVDLDNKQAVPEPVVEHHGNSPDCPDTDCISMLVNGDLLFHPNLWKHFAGANTAATAGTAFDFTPLFETMKPYIQASDIAVCEFETPIAKRGGPYTGYPVFNVPPEVADAAASVGYTACTHATNHSWDQGADGIAVGLASKILPHNFVELINAAIAHLQGRDFQLYPDFPTGGMADVSRYNDGLRGGTVKVRAKISKIDKRTLAITEIPYTTTTESIKDSIIKANDKGKIKIRKVDDNTADKVEIVIQVSPDESSDKTIDALYAFTDCEVSIAPNSCVIWDEKPHFLGVSEILRRSAEHTKSLLGLELKIRLGELSEAWHAASLERIFIENRLYQLIEGCKSREEAYSAVDKGLEPFKMRLRREVTLEDVQKLTELKFIRISRYDSEKADNEIRQIEEDLKSTQYDLDHLTEYAVAYYERIRDKYGKGRHKILTLVNSFHGRTLCTLSATGQDVFHNYFFPFVEGFDYVTANDIADLEAKLDDTVCAVMLEYIQGEGGVNALEQAFVDAVFEKCAAKDVLVIADEVQTGVGRTGTFLAGEQFGHKADVTTLAKGIAGGLPMGACLANEKCAGVLDKGSHGSTFGGNPVCCAGGLAVLNTITADGFLAEVQRKAKLLREKLEKLDGVESVSGLGLMIGIALKDKKAIDVANAALEKGLLVLTAKTKVRLLPPLTITDEEIEKGVAILADVLSK